MTDATAIHDLFGSFRAEWLKDDIFKLFSEPTYFTHLLGNKSCVLTGGRGSGKTTVLRCLSFEGQRALQSQDWAAPTHVGVYYRVNTNIVTAFDGPELRKDEWRRIFGHFLNLTICGELAKYASWHINHNSNTNFSNVSLSVVGNALGVGEAKTFCELQEGIVSALTQLEIYINNLGHQRPTISQLQSPITHFLQQLKKVDGLEKTGFHIILDEYENLLDYQQQIVNTMIKHSGDNCYFKIGVRELGWRVHTTLNDNESLISPADYELINIEERLRDNFAPFARAVCESRLKSGEKSVGAHLGLDKLLPALSTIEEANLLGVGRRVEKLRQELKGTDFQPHLAEVDDFVLHVFHELTHGNIEATKRTAREYVAGNKSARDKYENHAQALLFSLADKGASIGKHYCGHETFARIAHGNIRFYMQLVHESIVQQIEAQKDLSQPIGFRDQTLAARRVGLNYLRELEGATSRGSYLSKLILGFGRLFQIFAENPVGGAPERNQFHVRDTAELAPKSQQEDSAKLLTEAIMHLALVRSPGTKLAAETDTRAWDYAPHPIFSPYFSYSSRRKRKISVSDADLIAMSKSPQATIKKLLGQDRQHLANSELPPQMSMFDEFFK